MNPTDLIFTTVSDLTGGLITDMTTLVIGLITLAFILMGLDLLLAVFNHALGYHAKNKEKNNISVDHEESEKQGNYEVDRADYKRSL